MDAPELKALGDAINRSLKEIAERFAVAFLPFAEALKKFGEAFYTAACSEYLRSHSRLPGSDRTSRLRKKRRKVVLDWFAAELQREAV